MRVLVPLLTLLFITACRSEYHQTVERELASGELHNDMFLGLELGMSRDSFFTKCFRLNKQGVIHQGLQNNTAEWPLPIAETGHPARMNFYPDFIDNKIYRMPVTFRYDNWAPWNKDVAVDSAVVDVVELLERWHGPGFIHIGDDERGHGWVKVDGNRRILVTRKDIQQVKVVYQDLLVEAPERPAPTAKFPGYAQ